MKDYYKILEIKSNATAEDIKKAYRKLSKKYHPDINPTGTEQFKLINEAKNVLSDLDKRKTYDNQFNSNQQSKTTTKKPANRTNATSSPKQKTTTVRATAGSTIIVNGVKINVNGNNTTSKIKVVNGKVIIETSN